MLVLRFFSNSGGSLNSSCVKKEWGVARLTFPPMGARWRLARKGGCFTRTRKHRRNALTCCMEEEGLLWHVIHDHVGRSSCPVPRKR